MTRQLLNSVRYRGRVWQQIALHGQDGFEPHRHGFEARGNCTALHRGWYGEFSAEPRLRLQELHVNHWVDGLLPVLQRRVSGPMFNGVSAVSGSRYRCNSLYRGLELSIPFSGGLLLARDYDVSLGGRYGNAFWMYAQVCELIYRRGRLVEAIDHAYTIALARESARKPAGPALVGLVPADLDPPARERLASRFRYPY